MSSLGQYTPMSAELMDALRNLTDWIELANAASGGTLLPVVASLLVVVLVAAISWMWRRSRPVEEMADPAYNPGLDRHQRIIREALQGEADELAAQWRGLDKQRGDKP